MAGCIPAARPAARLTPPGMQGRIITRGRRGEGRDAMERKSGAYTHAQEHTGHGARTGEESGHAHTEPATPDGATTNEIDARRAAPDHGPETQQPTRVVEAEGLKRLREEEGRGAA